MPKGVFDVNEGGLTLNNITVSGIHNFASTVTLNGTSSVTNNTATFRGGDIYTFGAAVTLNGASTVTDNIPINCFPVGGLASCVG